MPTTSFNKDSAKSALANMQSVMPQDNELNNAFTPTVEIITPISTEHDSFLKDHIASIESGGEIYKEYEEANAAYNKLVQSLTDTIATIEKMDTNGKVEDPKDKDPLEDPDDKEKEDPDDNDPADEDPDDNDPLGDYNYYNTPSGGYGPSYNTPSQVVSTPTDTLEEEKEADEPTDDIDADTEEEQIPTETTETSVVTTPTVTKEQSETATDNQNPNGTNTPTEIVTETTPTDSGTVSTVVGAGTAAVVADGLNQNPEDNPEKIEESGVPYKDDNAFGSHKLTKESWDSLSETEKEKVKKKLKDLGYTDSEINDILNGGASIPKLSLDAVANTLEEAIKTNPGLREEIISRYGFDVFNSDGSVNKDKLAIALMMDNASGTDKYSLIELLHSNYGIDVVDSSLYNELANRLEKYIVDSPTLRQKLIDRYGFDIFNADGTINRDKLTLAILMDNQSNSDEYDLTKLLDELFGAEEEAIPVVSNPPQVVKIETPQEPTKKKKSNALPVLLGLGAAGAAVGGGVYLAKKKKEEEEEEGEEDDIYFQEDYDNDNTSTEKDNSLLPTQNYEAKPEGKQWLHGIGVNLDIDPQRINPDDINDRNTIEIPSDFEEQFEKRNIQNQDINIEKVKPKYAEEDDDKSILPYVGAAAGAGIIGKEIYDRKKDKEKEDDDNSDNSDDGLKEFMG